MKKLTAFFHLVRYPNLLIIAGTMLMLKFMLYPSRSAGQDIFFLVYTLIPVLVAAAGYVINDYVDISADKINKPGKLFIEHFSPQSARAIYITFNIIAIGISLVASIWHSAIFYITITAILLLFIYSLYLKKTPLLGNVAVALTSACIPFLVIYFDATGTGYFAEEPYVDSGTPSAEIADIITINYIFISFWGSLLREITKDIEDYEGDKRSGITSTAVFFGIPRTRLILYIVYLLPSILYFARFHPLLMHYIYIMFSVYYISSIPFIVTLVSAREKKHFSRASFYLKLSMVAGIISIPFIYYFHV